MDKIDYKIPVDDGSEAIANFTAPVETMDEMYPEWRTADGLAYISPEYTVDGISMQAVNSSLRFELATSRDDEGNESDRAAVFGNTVKRLCGRLPEGKVSCEGCAVLGLTVADGVARNCARSNTATVFEQAHVPAEGRLMLLPTKSDVLVLSDELPGTVEMMSGEAIYRTLPAAQAVVIPESKAKELGLERFGAGMNGADSTFGMATFVMDNEKVAIAFCSTRENMGDRTEDEQVVRKAINAYLDSRGLEGDERQAAIEGMDVSVMIGASATLRNFAHKIEPPKEKYAEQIKKKWGKITNAGVLDNQYPGALERGNVWPEFEAQLVELAREKGEVITSPIGPDNCPGDGQTCHVDYRAETKYAIEKQLEALGVRNVYYDDSHAMDPADVNNMASNRREQNNGVERSRTNRTINGMVVTFGS